MSWVGGDIPELQSAGRLLKSAPDKVGSVIHDLSGSVDRVIDSASWGGEAADAMRAKWSRNAIEVADVGTFISTFGESLEQLGDGLSHVDGALYDAADACRQRGAQIDMSNGKPAALIIKGNQNTPAAQEAIKAQSEYQVAYTYAMQSAQALRMAAAAEIESLVKPVITPAGNPGAEADRPTMAGILRSIYTGQHEATGMRIQGLEKARTTAANSFDGAANQLERDLKAFAKNGGPTLPASLLQNASGFDSAFSKFQAVEKDVAVKMPALQGKTQLPGAALLNTKVEDIAKALPKGELAAKLKLFKSIPVLDVAASGAGTYFQVKDDLEKGAELDNAILQDGGAALGGILGGAAVAEAVAMWIPGPGWAIAAGIGVGVLGGDGLYQGFHEHWSEDIHDYGVVHGIGHGIANTASREWGDMKAMGSEVGSLVSKAWRGIFG